MAMKDLIRPDQDPQIGNLLTPINGSKWAKNWLRRLPAYRSGLAASRRGVEIGMAHGYFIYGPFAVLGPMRQSPLNHWAGLLSAAGLVAILTLALTLYGRVRGLETLAKVTAPPIPNDLCSAAGWSAFSSSFLVGGLGGAFVAFLGSLVLRWFI